jgi:hypothetical protein
MWLLLERNQSSPILDELEQWISTQTDAKKAAKPAKKNAAKQAA